MDVGKELKKNGIKYSFGTSPLPMYIIDKPVKIAILNNKYADGAERVVGTTAIGLMESINESLNENKYSIIDPKGNTAGTGTKDQANRRAKTLGGSKKGYFVVPAKKALVARRTLEKHKFDFKNAKLQNKMSDLYFESVVNEAKYDIGMARKGNGLTVYNKAEEESGDYKNVAHIDNKGKIKYYDKKLPSNIKKEIEAEAKKMMEVKTEGTMKLKNLLKESIGIGELPSSKLMMILLE